VGSPVVGCHLELVSRGVGEVVNLGTDTLVDERELVARCVLFIHDGEDMILHFLNKQVQGIGIVHVNRGRPAVQIFVSPCALRSYERFDVMGVLDGQDGSCNVTCRDLVFLVFERLLHPVVGWVYSWCGSWVDVKVKGAFAMAAFLVGEPSASAILRLSAEVARACML
jgi:hypothetical protein